MSEILEVGIAFANYDAAERLLWKISTVEEKKNGKRAIDSENTYIEFQSVLYIFLVRTM